VDRNIGGVNTLISPIVKIKCEGNPVTRERKSLTPINHQLPAYPPFFIFTIIIFTIIIFTFIIFTFIIFTFIIFTFIIFTFIIFTFTLSLPELHKTLRFGFEILHTDGIMTNAISVEIMCDHYIPESSLFHIRDGEFNIHYDVERDIEKNTMRDSALGADDSASESNYSQSDNGDAPNDIRRYFDWESDYSQSSYGDAPNELGGPNNFGGLHEYEGNEYPFPQIYSPEVPPSISSPTSGLVISSSLVPAPTTAAQIAGLGNVIDTPTPASPENEKDVGGFHVGVGHNDGNTNHSIRQPSVDTMVYDSQTSKDSEKHEEEHLSHNESGQTWKDCWGFSLKGCFMGFVGCLILKPCWKGCCSSNDDGRHYG
jgi:hypothetical protein